MTLNRSEADRYVRDIDFLLEVTKETLASLQLGSLLRRIVRLMRDRFGYDFAAVALVEDDMVVFRAGTGGDLDRMFQESGRQFSWRVPVGQGIVGKVVHSGKPTLANDVLQNPDYLAVGFLPKTRAELTVPICHRDKTLGVLDVQSHSPQAFDETDVRLLEIVGALVAPAVHVASLYERERHRSRHLHLVSEISRLVMSSLDKGNIISLACEAILDALDISYTGISLLDRSGLVITHGGHASRQPVSPEALVPFQSGEGLIGKVIASGKSLRLGDVDQSAEFKPIVSSTCSALCVPLRIRERIIGAMNVEHSVHDYFTSEEERLLENIATYLAQAMENAQLFDNQRRRWQQLLVINEVARVATGSIDFQEIISLVATETHNRFGYFVVAIMLVEDQDVVIRALACDETLERVVGFHQKLGEGIPGQVALTGAVIQWDRPTPSDGYTGLRGDIQSILSVPLWSQSGVIGVLQIESREHEAFNQDDRIIIETLAKSVAGAIANAHSIVQAEQLREDLTRMIVHDLRNPVQAVLLTLQEVQKATESKSQESLNDTIRNGISLNDEMLEMINSMLDVSRFEAGKAQLRLRPTVLNDHIRAAVKRLAPLARVKQIQVTSVLSQDVPVLKLDHELISRTLTNLISNALKFTPEGARVTIRSELVSEPRPNLVVPVPLVLVAVQDTGEGIPQEYHRKIFEKFGQVESRKAGIRMSTGLGLALCRYVVEAHGGIIWVDSTLGKGSCFYFTLPLSPSSGGG